MGLWHNLYHLAKVRIAQYTNGLQRPAKPNAEGLFVFAKVRRRTSKLVLSPAFIYPIQLTDNFHLLDHNQIQTDPQWSPRRSAGKLAGSHA